MAFAPLMAPSYDKDSDLYGQSMLDEPGNEFFDQFLSFDAIEDDRHHVYSALNDPTHLVKSPSIGESAGTSSTPRHDNASSSHHQLQSAEPWDVDIFHNPQAAHFKTAANNTFLTTEDSTLCSDNDLLSLEGVSLHSPYCAPASPTFPSSPGSPQLEASPRRRNRFIDSLSKTLSIPKLRNKTVPVGSDSARSPIRKVTAGSPVRKVTLGSPVRKVTAGAVPEVPHHHLSPQRSPTRSPVRKSTSPAKMMRTTQYSEQHLHEWQARLQAEAAKFDFGFQNSHPLSPPPSARVSDASDHSNQVMIPSDSHLAAFTWDQPVPQYASRQQDVHTPLTTPTTGSFAVQPLATNQMLYSQLQAQDSWDQQTDLDFNPFVATSAFAQEPSQNASQVWWSNASSAPLAQPSPTGYHKTPIHDTKTLAMQLQNELVYNASELAMSPSALPQGLMIQLPRSPMPQSYVTTSPMPMPQMQSYFPPLSQQQQQQQQQQANQCIIPQTARRFTQPQLPLQLASPRTFRTPQQVRKSRSRGQLDESPSPTCRSASMCVTKNRSRTVSAGRSASQGRQGRTDRAPSTPNRTSKGSKASGSGFADFVNFTPSDSGKILTGVAPSGSSKTKARREKEAMDKRRRLSLAAVRAVQAAGGSIEHLVEEGLFVGGEM